MTALIPIAYLGAIPLALGLFARMRPHRALIVFHILAWQFLPVATFDFPILPAYDKHVAVGVATLIAILTFDPAGLRRAQFSWADVPMLVLCCSPFATSLSNGLGVHDGLSSVFRQLVVWGLPYWCGRCYIQTLAAVRDLTFGFVVGGVTYIIFCLWEIRMSPQLHLDVYGVRQHSWEQVLRMGGYRPMVFMHHGLMLSLWMAMSGLTAWVLARARCVRRVGPLPIFACATALIVTAVLCKSGGAALLLVVGIGLVEISSSMRTNFLLTILACSPLVYCVGRLSGGFSGRQFVELASRVSEERAGSLLFRLDAEERLMGQALIHPLLGWGGFSRSNPVDDWSGKSMSIPDSLWIGLLGSKGLLGLGSYLLASLVPLLLGLKALGDAPWRSPRAAPLGALIIVLLLFAIDCLSNAFVSPVYVIMAGALTTVAIQVLDARRNAEVATFGRCISNRVNGPRSSSNRWRLGQRNSL